MINGMIYKIVNSIDNKIYIGSTHQKYLCDRMTHHRFLARHQINPSRLYCYMRKLGVENFKIVLIRKVSAVDKDALEKEEFAEMDKRSPKRLLNMNIVYGQAGKGKDSSRFKRGSISRIGGILPNGCVTDVYQFRWQEWADGKSRRITKSFSIIKYGRREAKQKAIEMQNLIYPQ